MNFKLSAIAAALAAATLSAGAGAAAVDFHGYARSGVGASTEGGSMVCYRNVGSMGFYRLGNECDTYFELAFDANLAEKGDTKFNLHTMVAAGTQQLNDWEQSTPAWRQIWAEATNVGSGPLATANIWAGKRFYKRQDIHMLDYFYVATTGPGVGLENVDFGFAKFSAAILRDTEQDWSGKTDFNPDYVNGGNKAQTRYDLRLEGIQLGNFGAIDGILTIGQPSTRDNVEGKSGYAFTAQHTIGVVGGFNRFILQYATDGVGLDHTARTWAGPTTDYTGSSVMDHFVFDLGSVNGSAFLGFREDKWGDWDTKTTSFGVRPWYHFNDLYSIGGEFGHVEQKDKGSETKKLDKLTLAAQISAGKSFWARPAIRAYYTYAKWNDALKGSNVTCTGRDCGVQVGGDLATATNGSTVGAQFEAWW